MNPMTLVYFFQIPGAPVLVSNCVAPHPAGSLPNHCSSGSALLITMQCKTPEQMPHPTTERVAAGHPSSLPTELRFDSLCH